MERALREGREGADRLDLVAEEVDPERLAAGRREHVDDPAAHGELAAVVGAIDPRVAGEREVFRERVESRLVARGDPDRLRPVVPRRHPLGKRRGGGADETAACEDIERTRALAHEVRRRLESGVPADAAAREQRDALLAEEPRGGLGSVASVGVLGQHGDQRPLEPLVEGREQERKRRLGHASVRRQRLGEGDQPLVLDELADEGVQDRTVHDEWRNRRFRGLHRSHGPTLQGTRTGVTQGPDPPPAQASA